MALPSTNITFNAVNVELNGASGTSISLDNSRVRSLGNNLNAAGSAFSISSLATKTAKFAFSVNSSVSNNAYVAQGLITPATDQNCFYCFTTTEDPGGGGGNQQFQIRKLYLNGTVASTTRIAANIGFLAEYAFGVGFYSFSNIYINAFTNTTSDYSQGLAKINTSGTLLESWKYTGGPLNNVLYPAQNSANLAVDSSENVYSMRQNVSGSVPGYGGTTSCYLLSVNSSLVIRWILMFDPEYSNFNNEQNPIGISGVDSSNNVYCQYQRQSTSAGNGHAGLIIINSSGNTVQNKALWFGASGNTARPYYRNGVGPYGQHAIFGYRLTTAEPYLAYYNAAGTLQWSRYSANSATVTYQASNAAGDCVIDVNGNVYTGLIVQLNSEPRYWFYITKFNSAGAIQWQRRIYNSNTSYKFLRTGNNCLSITGTNGSLITVSLIAYFEDEYASGAIQGAVTFNSDGSTGIGTYSLVEGEFTMVVDSTVATTWTAATVLSAATISYTSVSASRAAASTAANATPNSYTTTTIAIS